MHVLLSNHRAGELDVVRAGFATAAIVDAAHRTLVSGEPIDVDLSDRRARGGPAVVHAEVRAIGDDLVLVIAADESAAARVEAVRRDFVANVSHELKTPIGSVLLLAEALLDGADDPDLVRHFAGKIVHESNRLATLVSELIALSKLQGAAETFEAVTVPIDAVVDETLVRTATIATAAGTTVSVGGTEGLCVLGDRTLLVTALVNLVENAIHHSPPGTPVSINRALRDGVVELAVTDRGQRHPGVAAGARLRTVLPGRLGALAGDAGAPDWGWPSSSMSPPTTTARSRCGAGSAPVPRSPSSCRRTVTGPRRADVPWRPPPVHLPLVHPPLWNM